MPVAEVINDEDDFDLVEFIFYTVVLLFISQIGNGRHGF